ncbi:MAG: hypothetical protein N5P05_001135 [Chroococcopsis gigantea SAG 12.99]|jgi:predicted PurR-regulated permease PerM|nr:AI-2E family transporter [Chlorogloea purpurea SAG 13.99]MDV2999529.1 hypothetical protein [Chroococcopsis gigantea SAG 12.99]
MFQGFNQLPRWLRLGIAFPIAFLNGWLFFHLFNSLEPLISIFIIASLLAFLLDFPIRRLELSNISRGGATVIVLLLAVLILSLLGLILIPQLLQQLSDLINSLPQWIDSGTQQLQSWEKLPIAQKYSVYLKNSVSEISGRVANILETLSSQLLTFILSTIGSLLNILFVLVLTVFLVLYGEKLWDGVFSWLPSPWNIDLRESIRHTFERYFATQAILAGFLSIAQTCALAFLNVPYALLFGVTIGVTTLIPFASGFIIIIISVLLMFQDLWLGVKALIFTIIIGQINDNVISPRLMGGIIGLNPIWIILSLFIGGKIAGIIGLLVAVPIASVIKNTVDDLRDKWKEEKITPKILLMDEVKKD